jgi:hypothetical protein
MDYVGGSTANAADSEKRENSSGLLTFASVLAMIQKTNRK